MNNLINTIKKAVSLIETQDDSVENLVDRISDPVEEAKHQIPTADPYKEAGRKERLAFLSRETGHDFPVLSGEQQFEDIDLLKGNIENYIGMAQVPIGIMGPVKVKGIYTSGNYIVPMATTEGALVASYHRGAKACNLAGGITSIFMVEGVQRCPLFKFDTVIDAGRFTIWVTEQHSKFVEIVSQSSNYAVLENIDAKIQGNQVIISFSYETGDASGQNMVTICTQNICDYIEQNCPVPIKKWYIEGNYSGDKKANAVSFARVRGKKVTAEVKLPEEIVHKVLKTTPKKMADYWTASTVAVLQTGTLGAQGHFANGLTAIFMACGQDVACVSEAAVGVTRMEVTDDGSLYAAVTLPNLIVGTVGGGTGLPTQQECLKMMDCAGPGNARKFAEICAAVILGGELSIAAAMSAGHFTSAHQSLGRKK